MGRSRTESTCNKVPKGTIISDLEKGYVEKMRISYSYCLDCGRIVEGWQKSCSCEGKWKQMKQGWCDFNFAIMVNILNIRKKHKLNSWGRIG